MTRRKLARMFVMDAMADDYENLEKIGEEVGKLAARAGVWIDRIEVIKSLIELISEGLAAAYLLSSRPAVMIIGVPPLEELDQYCFWLTDAGMELQLSDDPDWPFDSEGALRADWSPPKG